MLNTATNPDLVNELRYALDVMEEYSHLGLDDAAANKLRNILVRRIEEAEATLSSRPAGSARFPIVRDKVLA